MRFLMTNLLPILILLSSCHSKLQSTPVLRRTAGAASATAGSFAASTNVTAEGFTLNWTAVKPASPQNTVATQRLAKLKYCVCSGSSLEDVNSKSFCMEPRHILGECAAGKLSMVVANLLPGAVSSYNVFAYDDTDLFFLYEGISQATLAQPKPECGAGTGPIDKLAIAATTATIAPSGGLYLDAGRSSPLQLICTGSNGMESDVTKDATWTASSSSVATIDVTGVVPKVTAVSRGAVTLTATYNGLSANVSVQIRSWHLKRVSTNSSGVEADQGANGSPYISADGRYVIFGSSSTNLVSSATQQTFRKDLVSGAIELVSSNASGVASNPPGGDSHKTAINGDGRYVAFSSPATNLVAGVNSATNPYVKDMNTGAIYLTASAADGTPVSSGNGWAFGLSSDGTKALLQSNGTNIISGKPAGGVYMKEFLTGAVTWVGFVGSHARMSPNGRYVLAGSLNVLSSNDTNSTSDSYRYDVFNDVFERASLTSAGSQITLPPASYWLFGAGDVTDDGIVYFQMTPGTDFPLVPGVPAGKWQVFKKNINTGAISVVSSDANGSPGDSDSLAPAATNDGRYLVFTSTSTNLVTGKTNVGLYDIYRKDMLTGEIDIVSRAEDGSQANAHALRDSRYPQGYISADGSKIVFLSAATNLVSGDTNSSTDVFLAYLD